MRRTLLSIATLLLAASAAGADSVTYKRGNRSIGEFAETFTVCDSGCDSTVLGNTDCTSENAETNAATSAIERARTAGVSTTSPMAIFVEAGVHEECATVNDMSGLSIFLLPGAVMEPTCTAGNCVNGGVLRIANDLSADSVLNVSVYVSPGARIQNNGWASADLEHAIQVGREGPIQTNLKTWDNVRIVNDGLIVGNRGALAMNGAGSASASPNDRSTIYLSGSGTYVSGTGVITKRGAVRAFIQGVQLLSQDNYCEAAPALEAFLGTVTGTVAGAFGAGDFFVAADDDPGVDDFYVDRMVTIGGGGACACDTHVGVIDNFNSSNNDVSTVPACVGTMDANCTYSIAAIPDPDESPCRHVDWSFIRAGGNNVTYGFNWGAAGDTVATPLYDQIEMSNSTIRIVKNESSIFDSNATCTASGASCMVAYHDNLFHGGGKFDNVDCSIEINAQQPVITSCANPVNGLQLTDAALLGNFEWFNSNIRIVSVDTDLNLTGIAARSTNANTVEIGNLHIDIDEPGSYTGAKTTITATSPTVVPVTGAIDSPELLTVSTPGNVTGWAESPGHFVTDGAGTGFAQHVVPIENSFVGVKIQGVACQCHGTCGGAETVEVFDAGGTDAIGAAAIACTDNDANLSFTDVSTDADGTLGNGDSPEVDEGTLSGTAGDDLVVFFRFTTNRWEN